MNPSDSLSDKLQGISEMVMAIASDNNQDYDHLLKLLRTLEALHREVRTEYFEAALPNTRKDLYKLMRDMEEEGGWPYIERGKIQTFLRLLDQNESQQ